MKKLFLLTAALAIVFANVVLACPPGWTEYPEVETITVGNCSYQFIYCYGIVNGLHSVSISQIAVISPCTGEDFDQDAQKVTDAILIKIATTPFITEWAGYETIPVCPGDLMCLLRMYDAICYDGWVATSSLDPLGTDFPVQVMNKCDESERCCNETVTICYDEINNEYVITRLGGGMMGPDCKEPCHTNCEY
ncbi:MAG: hypothetical protein GX121_01810 [Ignavibacteria bacterium]|jgi:hypothetical protein|nr:hypothetical protein [Ignavibacteria bacterium]